MHTCKDSIDKMLAFLDGEISPEEEEHLQAHLEGCPPCLDFLKTYRATPKLCKQALGEKMPAALADRLTLFLRQRCKK